MEGPKSLLDMVDTTTVVAVFIKVVVVSTSTTKVVASPTTNLQKFVSFLLARQPPLIRCHTSSSGCCKNFTYRFLAHLLGSNYVASGSRYLNFANFRPNGTIFDCELGCFVPIEEYHRRRSKESLVSVKEEKEEKEENEENKEKKEKEEEKREKL